MCFLSWCAGVAFVGLVLFGITNIDMSVGSSSVSSKYAGSHNGQWEGYLLNQYNQGSARFIVQNNGNAKLNLSGRYNVVHNGKIKGNKFITDKGQSCSIVDQSGGFKIVLIWTGGNVDVSF